MTSSTNYCKYHRTQSSCHHHHHRSQHITVLLVLHPKRRWYSSTGNDFRCESTEEPNSNVATHYKQTNNNILQAKMGDSHPTVTSAASGRRIRRRRCSLMHTEQTMYGWSLCRGDDDRITTISSPEQNVLIYRHFPLHLWTTTPMASTCKCLSRTWH